MEVAYCFRFSGYTRQQRWIQPAKGGSIPILGVLQDIWDAAKQGCLPDVWWFWGTHVFDTRECRFWTNWWISSCMVGRHQETCHNFILLIWALKFWYQTTSGNGLFVDPHNQLAKPLFPLSVGVSVKSLGFLLYPYPLKNYRALFPQCSTFFEHPSMGTFRCILYQWISWGNHIEYSQDSKSAPASGCPISPCVGFQTSGTPSAPDE